MACRQLTREEYENLPANAKAYEKESDCQCCRCGYYCTDDGQGLQWYLLGCESTCRGTKTPPSSPCNKEGTPGTGSCDDCS